MFLGSKVEEAYKKLSQIIPAAYEIRFKKKLIEDSSEFEYLRKQILACERIVLETISFELTVDHPYKDMFEQLNLILKEENKNLKSMAWNIINDRYIFNLISNLTFKKVTCPLYQFNLDLN